MVTNCRFTVVLEPDGEEPWRYNVRVPTLPGCLTYGESIEDALANAREAITGYVASVLAYGESVPIEVHPVIAMSIAIPVSTPFEPASEEMAPDGASRS